MHVSFMPFMTVPDCPDYQMLTHNLWQAIPSPSAM